MRRFLPLLMMIALGAAVLALGLAAPEAQAQALAFERVGDQPIDASDIAFDDEGALWAAASRIYRLPPGSTPWEEMSDPPGVNNYVLPLGPDTLLIGGIRRSVDGGETWVQVSIYGEALFEASSGVLLTGDRVATGVLYSDDRGASWAFGALAPSTWTPEALAFAELPAGHPHAGRIVGGFFNGLAYSDDGGHTWTKSSLWEGGRYLVPSVTVGVDGRVFASLVDAAATGTQIAVSADGGATYAIAYGFGVSRGSVSRIFARPGGTDPEIGVVVELETDGSVWRSDDGAETFVQVGHVPFVYSDSHLSDAAMGPDGRLYVAGGAIGSEDEWVWRTKKPVVAAAAVTAEAQPLDPPVVIGAGGGSFAYQVRLTNTTTLPQGFQAWSEASGPFSVSPVVGPVGVTLPPGASVVKTLVQQVPGRAPGGTYTYTVNTGAFPGSVLSSASFPVVKQGALAGAGGGAEGWAVSGWDEASAVVSSAPASLAVSPNPFRGAASVTLTLPEAGAVEVALYDVLGRRVALPHEGTLPAGLHRFRLEGTALPAGVYVVRLETEASVLTARMTRVR